MNLELFHGTNKEQALNILENGFTYPRTKTYPGDLGYGIYNFCHDEEGLLVPPDIAAKRYALKYRAKPIGIVVSIVKIDSDNFLNLDEDNNVKQMKAVRNNCRSELIKRVKKYKQQHPQSKVAKRANLDGYALEKFLKVCGLAPDIIFKEKWEDVDDEKLSIGGSEYANSKVAVIRNPSIIIERRMLS